MEDLIGAIFGVCLMIGVGVFLIVFAIQMWFITIPIILLILMIWMIIKNNNANANRERERKLWLERQAGLKMELTNCRDTVINVSAGLGRRITDANQHLAKATVDFHDRAFIPFWDSIENAMLCLGEFDADLNRISTASRTYQQQLKEYRGAPPSLTWNRDGVPDQAVVTEKARRLVRAAQCDFEFTQIYQSRQTNKILLAGFANLAMAVENIGDRIVHSITEMHFAVESGFSTISNQLDRISDKDYNEKLSNIEGMLNNIQRGRKPTI
jgi:hypothetical protein